MTLGLLGLDTFITFLSNIFDNVIDTVSLILIFFFNYLLILSFQRMYIQIFLLVLFHFTIIYYSILSILVYIN